MYKVSLLILLVKMKHFVSPNSKCNVIVRLPERQKMPFLGHSTSYRRIPIETVAPRPIVTDL